MIHADEFDELIGDEFIPLLNKAGGAGFQVIGVHADLVGRRKPASAHPPPRPDRSPATSTPLIMLRVKEVATARAVRPSQLPEVHVVSTVVSSSVSDTNDPVAEQWFHLRQGCLIEPAFAKEMFCSGRAPKW